MQGRCEQHARTDHPEERPFEREASPRRDRDHGKDAGNRDAPSHLWVRRRDFEQGEGALHEPPMLAVGLEPREEGTTGPRVGEVEQGRGADEGGGCPPAQSPRERGERRGRGDLGQCRERERDAGHFGLRRSSRRRATGGEDRPRQEEEAERLEVSIPGHLDHEQRSPGVQQQSERAPTPRALRDPYQKPCRREVAGDPDGLHEEHRGARQSDRQEGELGYRRVDGRDAGVVDERVPRRHEVRDLVGPRGEGERVQPGELDVAVPQVPPEIVGERGTRGEHADSGDHGEAPQERPDIIRFGSATNHGSRCERVGREGYEEQDQAGDGKAGPGRKPCEQEERGSFEESEGEELSLQGQRPLPS